MKMDKLKLIYGNRLINIANDTYFVKDTVNGNKLILNMCDKVLNIGIEENIYAFEDRGVLRTHTKYRAPGTLIDTANGSYIKFIDILDMIDYYIIVCKNYTNKILIIDANDITKIIELTVGYKIKQLDKHNEISKGLHRIQYITVDDQKYTVEYRL